MWYMNNITVPAGRVEAVPVEQTIKLTYGVLKYLGVGFPTGCNGLVRVRIYLHEHQLFPLNRDDVCAYSGCLIGGDLHERLIVNPFQLKAVLYSPDTDYQHIITVLCNVLPMVIAEPWQVLTQPQFVDLPE